MSIPRCISSESERIGDQDAKETNMADNPKK